MRKTIHTSIVFCTAFGVAISVAAEKKVKVQDLPRAVQETVKAQTKDSALVGVTKEVEDGKTVYELETRANGRARDLLIDGSGVIISVEQEVTLDAIPPAAKAAIEKRAGSGKITKVETVTKGQTMIYEAAVVKRGKRSEILVGSDGSTVKEP